MGIKYKKNQSWDKVKLTPLKVIFVDWKINLDFLFSDGVIKLKVAVLQQRSL
jgi:hypothetical protein